MITTRRFRGRSQSTPCRLWTRAPRMAIGSSLGALQACSGQNGHSIKSRGSRLAGLRRPRGLVFVARLGRSRYGFERRRPEMSAKKPAPVVDRRTQQARRGLREGREGAGQAGLRAGARAASTPSSRPSRTSGTCWSGPASYRAFCERALASRSAPPSSPRASTRPAELRRVPAQPRRVRGGAQVPAPGRGDPPQERARPLLPGRHRGAGGRHAPRPSRRCARRSRPARPTARPGARATPTSTRSASDDEFHRPRLRPGELRPRPRRRSAPGDAC